MTPTVALAIICCVLASYFGIFYTRYRSNPEKKPDFRTLESSRGSAHKPSRNPKIELYKTKNLSPLSDQLARMHIHAQSKFTHSTITTLPLCKSNVFVRRAATCN